jgi:hypothetical protein
LIRTKSNHILGPVSREKALELVRNGSIRPEDELCSGNGYWFYLREQELLERYLNEGQAQSFNPICEAPDVFRAGPSMAVPSDDDITLVGSLPPLRPAHEMPVAPRPVDRAPAVLDARDVPPPSESVPPAAPGKRPRRPSIARPLPIAPLPARRVSDKIVMWAAVMLLLALATALYYRKRLINEFLAGALNALVSPAHADEADTGKKKVR